MNRSQKLAQQLRAKNPSMPASEVQGIVGKVARAKGMAPGQSNFKPGGRPAKKGK